MDITKIKLLDNYQLMEIMKSESIDYELKTLAKSEFDSRDLSEDELTRINAKFSEIRKEIINLPDKPKWDPLYTPFLTKMHFNQMARLKAAGFIKEAKEYQQKFNFGTFVLGLILFALLGWGATFLKY